MAKTVEEIKSAIESLVKSQGNQGAISIGDILDDITELAGEGGGVGTPNVISVSTADGINWTVDNPDELEELATKAMNGEAIIVKITVTAEPIEIETAPAYFAGAAGEMQFNTTRTFIVGGNVVCSMLIISVAAKTVVASMQQYPA